MEGMKVGYSVLIAEDNQELRETVGQYLKMKGMNVTLVEDGVAAMKVLEHSHPDFLITDFQMPNMNGIELVTCVRGRAEFRNLPVIIMTGNDEDVIRRMAQRLRAVFMPKKDICAGLLRTVKDLLGQTCAVACTAP